MKQNYLISYYKIHQENHFLNSIIGRKFFRLQRLWNIRFIQQQKVPVVYDGILFEEGLRLDLLIDDLVIVELKAQENYHPVWEAQLLSYLKLADKRLSYLINFTVPLIKDGIKRMVL